MSPLGQTRPICDVRAMSAYAPTPDILLRSREWSKRARNGHMRLTRSPRHGSVIRRQRVLYRAETPPRRTGNGKPHIRDCRNPI